MGVYQTVQGSTPHAANETPNVSTHFQHRSNWTALRVVSRRHVILLHIICAALWKSAAAAHIPADFRFDYESPRNCGGTVSFDHFWSNVIGFIEHGGPLIFEHTHLCARRTCLSTIYICAKLRTPFSWWGQSKWPHLNLCRGRCVLFGTGSCMAIPSAQQRPS